jgi:hypothetical protein
MSETARLRCTKDYRLFSVSETNREVNSAHVRKLKDSMQAYGWIPAFPMLVHRTRKGLEILDGQHRFFVAKELGLPVWFVEQDAEYDVAKINAPQCPWKTKDYADSFAKRGCEAYVEAIAFAADNQIPLSDAAALLGGTISFGNIRKEWIAGTYRIRDRDHAARVAYLYTGILAVSRSAADQALRVALMAVARIPGLDYRRLIRNAQKMPERFVKFGSRDGALALLEFVYNFGTHGEKYPLKIKAENAMRERSAARRK